MSLLQLLLTYTSVLGGVSIAVKSYHAHGTYKGKRLQFRGSVHYHHGREHGGMQADMVLEKELRVLYLDLQATGSELSTMLSIA